METDFRNALVSVVVPTCERGYCIEVTVDSVLAQTHQNLEVLVVDDGSTDDTRERIERHYGADQRVKYVFQQNRGVSAARNAGLQTSSGDFIALLDSDDIWMPWKVELQLACLAQAPEAGMIWTDMEAVGPNGDVHSRRYLRTMYDAYKWLSFDQLFPGSYLLPKISVPVPGQECGARFYVGDIFSQMIMGNLVHTSTVLLRRERLGRVNGFNEELRFSGEDYDFHLRTCRVGPVAFADVASIQYATDRPDQLTKPGSSIHIARNCLRTLTPILAEDRDRISLPACQISQKLADVHRWIGESALNIEENLEAREHLFQSLRYRPLQPRIAALLLVSLLPSQFGRRLRAQAARWRHRRSAS